MGASQELIIKGFVIILMLMGASYIVPKLSTKTTNQMILSTVSYVSTMRDMATDYSAVSPTQDFQNISMEAFKAKNLLPSSITVNGTGSTSTVNPPHDTKQSISIQDPNSGSATDAGKTYRITIDSSASKMDSNDLQVFEDKLEASFTSSGGVVSGYTSTGADGIITVDFE